MKRWLILGMVCAAAAMAAVPLEAAEADQGKALRVLLTFGGHGFEQEPFFAMFDALPGVKYTKAPLPESAGLLKPGLEKDYDVIVMYDMVRGITPAEQENFVKLLEQGIGVVSLHHNLGAHRDWDEFVRIIGGRFFVQETQLDGRRYGKSGWTHGQDMQISVADSDHPITRGLKDFTIHDETYNNYYTAPDVRVLLKTDHPDNDPEIAWVHEYGKSRVFYLMLGHDSQAWKNPNYPKLLLGAIRWAAGEE